MERFQQLLMSQPTDMLTSLVPLTAVRQCRHHALLSYCFISLAAIVHIRDVCVCVCMCVRVCVCEREKDGKVPATSQSQPTDMLTSSVPLTAVHQCRHHALLS